MSNLYIKSYAEEAKQLCERGAGESDLARHFQCTIWDIRLWRAVHRDFEHAIRVAGAAADERVTMALYERATGFEYEEHKRFTDKDGKERESTTKKWMPGDVGAAQYWLENRVPEKWTNRVKIDHTVSNNDVRDISTEELLRIAAGGGEGGARAAGRPGKSDRVH